MFLPERDQYSASKRKLESQIASLFGGRIAELMIYGGDRVTTGASNDIERATELARNMVTRWGFSENSVPWYMVKKAVKHLWAILDHKAPKCPAR